MADKTMAMTYIASPYTHGDPALNVKFQMELFNDLLNMGYAPVAPLWSHFQHMHFPQAYDVWCEYDIEIIKRCDAVLSLNAEVNSGSCRYRETKSSGRDGEVEFAKSIGLPVFTDISDITLHEFSLSDSSAY